MRETAGYLDAPKSNIQRWARPIVAHGGARVEGLVDRFQAGDSIANIATFTLAVGRAETLWFGVRDSVH